MAKKTTKKQTSGMWLSMSRAMMIIILLTFQGDAILAQNMEEVKVFSGLMEPDHPDHPYKSHAISDKNEMHMFFSLLFLGYKDFISSQDGASCGFNPSCSEYGMLTVRKNGVVSGIFDTFDRLTRCHGFANEKYPLDEKSGLLIDRP